MAQAIVKKTFNSRWLIALLVAALSAALFDGLIPLTPFIYSYIIRYTAIFVVVAALAHLFSGYIRISIPILVTGVLLNFAAIIANGGYMPTGAYEQSVAAGENLPGYTSIIGARLYWLCDWIGGRMSIGDILLITGLLIFFVSSYRRGENFMTRKEAT